MRNSQWKEILKNYILNNYKQYVLFILFFLIGLFIGVMILNNCKSEQLAEVTTYINEFIANLKQTEKIDNLSLLFSSIKNNIILVFILWLAGTTVIGLPIVSISIFLRGLILGITISAITYTLGVISGIIFCIISIFLQNLIFIPTLLTLGVSSLNLYKSIVKDKRKANIKVEITRHTLICIIMFALLVISSLIESFLSITLLKFFIKYF